MLCAQMSVGMINVHHYESCNLPRHVHELLNEYGAIQSWVSKIKRKSKFDVTVHRGSCGETNRWLQVGHGWQGYII